MTEAQFKEYAKTLPGQKINWVGEVDEVKKVLLRSIYKIKVDMPASHIDVYIIGVKKDVAMSLKKNSTINFSGKIKKLDLFSSLFGMVDIVVHDATIEKSE